MSVPQDVLDAALQQVGRFCDRWAPDPSAMRIEHTVRGSSITIVERRPPWDATSGSEWSSQPIARLRFARETGTWRLLWPRHTGQWLAYEGVADSAGVGPLLAEITADPDGVFWG
jgi:hypothetical protein